MGHSRNVCNSGNFFIRNAFVFPATVRTVEAPAPLFNSKHGSGHRSETVIAIFHTACGTLDFLQIVVSGILGTVEFLLDTHDGKRLVETKAQMCHPAAWHLQLTQV